MSIIKFHRRNPCGRRSANRSDLLVYMSQSKSAKSTAVCLRVSSKILNELRWIAGDYVVASYDTESQRWTIERVSDDCGNKLSGKTQKGHGATVRFSVINFDTKQLGFVSDNGYGCKMLHADSKSAVFEKIDA